MGVRGLNFYAFSCFFYCFSLGRVVLYTVLMFCIHVLLYHADNLFTTLYRRCCETMFYDLFAPVLDVLAHS